MGGSLISQVSDARSVRALRMIGGVTGSAVAMLVPSVLLIPAASADTTTATTAAAAGPAPQAPPPGVPLEVTAIGAPVSTTASSGATQKTAAVASAAACSSNSFCYYEDAANAEGINHVFTSGRTSLVYQLLGKEYDRLYRKVGIPVIGTKTILSNGSAQVAEMHGYQASAGEIDLSQTCSGTAVSVNVPPGIGVNLTSSKETWSQHFSNTASTYEESYAGAFQCQARSIVTWNSTKSQTVSMTFKNTPLRATGSTQFTW
jgi:hypothetical protein